MLKKLREPVNSLTHWAGAILALAGLIVLLIVGWGTPAKVVSLIIYGASLIFLFSASATYHMVRVKDKALEIFRKIDETIARIDAGEYGYCESCGVEIGLKRLEARPTATLCIDCKTLDELRERQVAK